MCDIPVILSVRIATTNNNYILIIKLICIIVKMCQSVQLCTYACTRGSEWS